MCHTYEVSSQEYSVGELRMWEQGTRDTSSAKPCSAICIVLSQTSIAVEYNLNPLS